MKFQITKIISPKFELDELNKKKIENIIVSAIVRDGNNKYHKDKKENLFIKYFGTLKPYLIYICNEGSYSKTSGGYNIFKIDNFELIDNNKSINFNGKEESVSSYIYNNEIKNDEYFKDFKSMKEIEVKSKTNNKIFEKMSNISLYYKLKKIGLLNNNISPVMFLNDSLVSNIENISCDDLFLNKNGISTSDIELTTKKVCEFIEKGSYIENGIIYVIASSILELLLKKYDQHIYYITNQDFSQISIIKNIVSKYESKSMKKVNEDLNNVNNYISNSIEILSNSKRIVCLKVDNGYRLYLKELWDQQTNVCKAISKIFDNMFNYLQNNSIDLEIKQEDLNNEQYEFLKISVYQKSPVCILHGRAGSGKSTVIKKIVEIKSKIQNYDILLCSFQGSVRNDLKNIIKEIKNSKSETFVMTIDKFKIEFEKNKEKYSKIKCIIIDEIEVVGLRLFSEFLLLIKDFTVQIICVGDKDQFQSISDGNVMNDLLCSFGKHELTNSSVIELIKNNRFVSNEDDSLINNMNLIYERSNNIVEKFKSGKDLSTTTAKFEDWEKFKSILKNIYKIHNDIENIRIFTPRNKEMNIINNIIKEIPEYNTIKTKEKYLNIEKIHTKLSKYNNKFKIGQTIQNGKNQDEFILENCFILNEEHYKKLNNEYNNMFEMLKDLNHLKVKLISIKSAYCPNGMIDTIEKIKYGYYFNTNKIIKRSSIKKLMKNYDVQFITVYYLKNSKKKIMMKNINTFTIGMCKTINGMHGSQSDIGIFVIPKEIKINSVTNNYRKLLVALTRSRKQLYILYQGNKITKSELQSYKNEQTIKWIDDLMNKDQSLFELTIQQTLQVMTFNDEEERISDMNDFIYDCICQKYEISKRKLLLNNNKNKKIKKNE